MKHQVKTVIGLGHEITFNQLPTGIEVVVDGQPLEEVFTVPDEAIIAMMNVAQYSISSKEISALVDFLRDFLNGDGEKTNWPPKGFRVKMVPA